MRKHLRLFLLAVLCSAGMLTTRGQYCTPVFTAADTSCARGVGISRFTVTGEAGSMINDSAACNGTSNYDDYTASQVVNFYTGTLGMIYNATISATSDTFKTVQVWIDFNDDFTFQTTESVGGSALYTTTPTGLLLTIPGGAPAGPHRMRVYVTVPITASSLFYPLLSPCGSAALGEARDYTAYIGFMNHRPQFSNGTRQTWSICQDAGASSLNPILSAYDADTSQTITWTTGMMPAHGTLSGFPYSDTTNGGSITPSGLTYTPAAGYSGMDSFTVVVSDTGMSDTTMVRVTINPVATMDTVADRVFCAGDRSGIIRFTSADTSTTYMWTNDNTSIGLAASGTTDSLSFTATNTTSMTATATIMVTPMSNGCSGIPETFTIIVRPTPALSDTIADQVVCSGSMTMPVTFTSSLDSTTYTWMNDNTAIGLASSGTGNIPAFMAMDTMMMANDTAMIMVMPVRNGCTGMADTFMIVVRPAAMVDTTMDYSFCAGDTVRVPAFTSSMPGTTFMWTSGDTSIGIRSSGSDSIAYFVATNSDTVTRTATVVVMPMAGTCSGMSDTFTISVRPRPTVTGLTNRDVCNGVPFGGITFTGGFTGTTFSWTNSDTSIGLPSLGLGNIPAFTPMNDTTFSRTAVITVTPMAGVCSGTPRSFNLRVNPTPMVDTTMDMAVCANSMTMPVTFTGSPAGTIFTWMSSDTTIGIARTGTGNIASFNAMNSTDTARMAMIMVTPMLNGCMGMADTFTITVNAAPMISPVADQSLCAGTMTTAVNFTSSMDSVTYTWTNNNTSIGLAASDTGNIPAFMAMNSGTRPDTAMIRVVTMANGCMGMADTFMYIVSPTPVLDTTTPNQTLCAGAMTMPVNFTATTGSTIMWMATDSTTGLNMSDTGNIAAFTARNNSDTDVTTRIIVRASFPGCSSSADTFTITVHPMPTVNATPDQSVCAGSMTTAVTFSGMLDSTSFMWTNDNTTIGLAAMDTGNIPAFMAMNSGTRPDTAMIRVVPMANGCTGRADTFMYVVTPTPMLDTTASQVLCADAFTTAINFTASSGAMVIWRANDTTIGLAGTDTGNIASFQTRNTTGRPVVTRIIATAKYPGCSSMPDTFTITVNPVPTVRPTADQRLCAGSMTLPVTFAGSADSAIYAWTNNMTSIGLAASGTGRIPAFMAMNSGATADTARVIVTPSAGGCTGMTDTFYYIVSPTPMLDTTASQTLCAGAATIPVIFAATTGSTITWMGSDTTIGIALADTANGIPSFTARNNTARPVTSRIIAMAAFPGCASMPDTFTITVNPTPMVNTPASQTLCNGDFTNRVVFTGRVAGTRYNWMAADTMLGNMRSGMDTLMSFAAMNTTDTPKMTTIFVTPVAFGCTGATDSFTITVNPTPDVDSIVDRTFCAGSNTPVIRFTGSVSGTTYFWTVSDSSIGIRGSGADSIGSFMAMDTTSGPLTVTVTVRPSAYGCVGANRTFTITINPGSGFITPADRVVCTGVPTSVIRFTSIDTGTTYTWVNRNPSIGLVASGSGDSIPSFTPVNPSDTYRVATIVIRPAGGACFNYPDSFTITVAPAAPIDSVADMAVCNGQMSMPVNFSSTLSGTTFMWMRYGPAIGLSDTGTGNIASFLGSNSAAAPLVDTIVVRAMAYGCAGMMDTFTITVNPTPVLTSTPNPGPVCDSTLFTYTPSSATMGVSYSWQRVATAGISGTSSGTGSIAEYIANTTSSPVSVTYIYSVTANGCVGTSNVTVTVNPMPMFTSATSATICDGTPFRYAPTYDMAGVTYNWTRAAVTGITPSTGAGSGPINETLRTSLTGSTTVQYVFTATTFGCTDTSVVRVTVGPAAVAPVIATAPTAVCANTMYQNFSATADAPMGMTYRWTASNAVVYAQSGRGALINFPTPGTAMVMVTVGDSASGCTASDTVNVTVGDQSAVISSVIYRSGMLICLNNDVETYQWGYDEAGSFDSVMIPGATFQTYDPGASPDFTMRYYWVITTKNGCSQKNYYNRPTAVPGVQADVQEITVYPNPSTGMINITAKSSANDNFAVQITDLLGRKLITTNMEKGTAKVDVSGLDAGVYMVNCLIDGVTVNSVRFVKQ